MGAFPSQAWQIWVCHVKLQGFLGVFSNEFCKVSSCKGSFWTFFATMGSGAVERTIFLEAHVTKGDMTGKTENGRRPKMQPFPTSSQMMSPAIVTLGAHTFARGNGETSISEEGGLRASQPFPLPKLKKGEGLKINFNTHVCFLSISINVCTKFLNTCRNSSKCLQIRGVNCKQCWWGVCLRCEGPQEIRFRFRVSIKIFRLTQFFSLSP